MSNYEHFLDQERAELLTASKEMQVIINDFEYVTDTEESLVASVNETGNVSSQDYSTYQALEKFLLRKELISTENVSTESYYAVLSSESISKEGFLGKVTQTVKTAIKKIIDRIIAFFKAKGRSFVSFITRGKQHVKYFDSVISKLDLISDEDVERLSGRVGYRIPGGRYIKESAEGQIDLDILGKTILGTVTDTVKKGHDILDEYTSLFRNLGSDLLRAGVVSTSVERVLTKVSDTDAIYVDVDDTDIYAMCMEVTSSRIRFKIQEEDTPGDWSILKYRSFLKRDQDKTEQYAPKYHDVPMVNEILLKGVTKEELVNTLSKVRRALFTVEGYVGKASREWKKLEPVIKNLEKKANKEDPEITGDYFKPGLIALGTILTQVETMSTEYLVAPMKAIGSVGLYGEGIYKLYQQDKRRATLDKTETTRHEVQKESKLSEGFVGSSSIRQQTINSGKKNEDVIGYVIDK